MSRLAELKEQLEDAYERLDDARASLDYQLAKEDKCPVIKSILAELEELEYEIDQLEVLEDVG